MPQRKKQTFLQGAMILITATMMVKVIGAFFKMPLTNIIGAAGMGYFNIAYGLFNTLYALSVAGLPVAVCKLVAENAAAGRWRDVRRIRRLSFAAFLCTGSAGAALMLLGAGPYVRFNRNEEAYWAVLVMAPAILFVCITSSFRGYYEGLRNMYPTATSQVVEAVFKLWLGLWLATWVMQRGLEEYNAYGTVFGCAQDSLEHARLAVLPYAAAGAIGGIVASTAAGALYLFLRHSIGGDGITRAEIAAAPPAAGRRLLLRRLLQMAMPVCLGAIVLNVTTLIDVSSITNRLAAALERDAPAVLRLYRHAIPAAMDLEGVPNFLYGTYTMAVTVFNLVPALTTTFGVSALPVIASAWAARDKNSLTRGIESVLRVTALVAFPAGCGLCALAEPLLQLIYPGDPNAALAAAPMLRMLGVAVMFVSLATPVNSMLQAIGRVDVPVKRMLAGAALKLAVNFILIAQPALNIRAAPFGTLLCYALILCTSLPTLLRGARARISLLRTFFKPLAAAAMCGLGAWSSFGLFSRQFQGRAATLLAMAVGGLVYVTGLVTLRVITKDDIFMLPNGEKIAKTLEKKGLIR